MSRIRISTTVDGDRLAHARRLLGLRDSDLFDMALDAVVRDATITQELAALDRFPYTADPELTMPVGPSDQDNAMAYTGEVPPNVRALAKQRRARQVEVAKR
ncbi:MAG: hypothetical protein ACSLFB_08310 [Acidimicrobiales bacterium]